MWVLLLLGVAVACPAPCPRLVRAVAVIIAVAGLARRLSLPSITHLQFLVLGLLLDGPRAGRDIRPELRQHGVRRTAPAFYQMMARLEDAGFVEGWYDQKVIDGQLIKERHCRLRPAGVRAWSATRDFYVARLRAALATEQPSNG